MKTKIFALAAAALVIGGLGSCNKTENQGAVDSGNTGNLSLSISFASSPSTKLSATDQDYMRPSSAKSDLVSLALVFVKDGETTVSLVQDVTQYINMDEAYVSGIPTGTYTVYALANYTTASTTASQYGYGGLPSGSFSLPNVGDNLSSVASFDIATATVNDDLLSESSTYSAFTAAPNYFVGSTSNVVIQTEQDTRETIEISRPVNLVRVKVAVGGNNQDSNGQPVISLSDTDANGLMVRRVQSSYNFYTGNYAFAASPARTLSYSPTPFTTIESVIDVPDGYIGTTGDLADWVTDGYVWYKDMLVFPPDPTLDPESEEDSDQNPDLLNIVVYGVTTTDDYKDRSGNELAQGAQVAWYGSVDLTQSANYNLIGSGNVIVVMNVTLNNLGDGSPVPPIEDAGNLYITLEIMDWDAIIESDVIEL